MADGQPLAKTISEAEKEKIFYIMFCSFHDVLKAEKLLKSHHLDVEIVPVPRGLNADCGVCIKSKSPVELLFGLLSLVVGVKCYVFDGVQYRPGRSQKREAL